jgi:DNA helicase HerA-like ATPase
MLDGEVITEVDVNIPLKTINRHGLIAGATGTGKTKTLQVFVEQLSHKGIPSLVMDIKGDLSGIAVEGEQNDKINERYAKTKLPYQPQSFPVELMTISSEKGLKLRATVTEFGPVLLSKILGLNDTQASIMSIVFKYSDDKGLPLIDLDDLKKVLQYVTDNAEGKKDLANNYGAISPASLGAILRSIVAMEQQGATGFFGEPSFDVEDLLQTRGGKGVVNVLRVADIQNQPQLFSTFMLSLFAEIYMTFPEEGDSGKPKLVLFIDEAHLIFNEASKTLLSQIETMVKLIRSKGVGIYFITQIPGDVPENVLSQLGLKIQHRKRLSGLVSVVMKNVKHRCWITSLSVWQVTVPVYRASKPVRENCLSRYYVKMPMQSQLAQPPSMNYLTLTISTYVMPSYQYSAMRR